MVKVKQLSECKHPNSRKTKALQKQIHKVHSRDKKKLQACMKNNVIGEKLLWFQENLLQHVNVYNAQQTMDLIQLYLNRFNEELDQIAIKHSIGERKNRQHANREDIIRLTITKEMEEFHSGGLEIPDIMNGKQIKILRDWNGQLRYLPNFKLKRYSQKFLCLKLEHEKDVINENTK